MRCRELMKEDIFACRTNDPIYRAAESMATEGVGFLPVQDSMRRLVGVLTDRDLVVRALSKRLDSQTPVGRVMTARVVSCKALDPIEKAEELMAGEQVSRLPVLDDFGECVGIISLSDIAQVTSPEESGALLSRVTEREAQHTVH